MKEIKDIIPFRTDKLIAPKITKVAYVPKGSDVAIYGDKLTYEEKVLEISFNNGEKVEKIRIRDLNSVDTNGVTKENRLINRVAQGGGHIIISDAGNRVIRVSNIISIDPKWEPIKPAVPTDYMHFTEEERERINAYSESIKK